MIETDQSQIMQLQAVLMAGINDELRDTIMESQVALATEQSKVDAEQLKHKSFIEENHELQGRLQAALKVANEKEKHAARLQKSLDIANLRRMQAEESVSQLLADPLVEPASTPISKEEIKNLKSQVKIGQIQLSALSETYLRREEDLVRQIESLKE